MVAVGLDGLLGEQVALEADGRLSLQKRQRVGEREQDGVPVAVGLLEERPAIADVGDDAGVVVGAVGVAPAEVEEVTVDLDRVDA